MRDTTNSTARLGRPPTISRGRIAAAAAADARERGLDSITVGSVAARLGVTSRALYHHIQGRDDIFAMACDHVLDPLTTLVLTPLGDTDSLDELLDQLRSTLLEHPGVGPFVLRQGLAGAVIERLVVRLGGLLAAAGVDPDETTARAVLLLSWSISAVMREHGVRSNRAATVSEVQESGTEVAASGSPLQACLASSTLVALERDAMLLGIVAARKPAGGWAGTSVIAGATTLAEIAGPTL